MKSLMITKYGSLNTSLKFQNMPIPKLEEDQILIKGQAASFNPLDYKIVRGDFKVVRKIKFPVGIGRDVSGIVEQVGNKVKKIKIGDKVFSRIGENLIGTMSEYVVSHKDEVAVMPENLSFEEAAGIPLAGLTAYQSLIDIAKLSAGETVLIHAGSGGVGSIAIQLAKHLGAIVTATTSTKNVAMVEKLGADKTVDYTDENYFELSEKFDVVFDTLGGSHTLDSFKVLKEGGRLVSIAGDLDEITAKQLGLNSFVRFILRMKASKITKAAKKKKAEYRFFLMSPNGKQLEKLGELYKTQKIRPVNDSLHEFKDSISAIEYLAKGRAKGKVIVKL